MICNKRPTTLPCWPLESGSSTHYQESVLSVQWLLSGKGTKGLQREVDWSNHWSSSYHKKTSTARLWKQLQCTEEARNCTWQVCQALGQNKGHSRLTQVNAPAPNSPAKCHNITNKEELEIACLEETCHQFSQAANMPILRLDPSKGLVVFAQVPQLSGKFVMATMTWARSKIHKQWNYCCILVAPQESLK